MTTTESDSQKLNNSYKAFSKNDVTWHWREWEELPYLTCSLLKNWSHGFFTHHFLYSTPTELVEVLHPAAEVFRVKQVHGNIVLTTGKATPETEGNYIEGDGLLTEKAKQAVWVCSADCIPVLIADRQTGQVAAIHAGWRGTAAKIVPEALAGFQAIGSKLSDLLIVLGPAIAGNVYQVSEEVAAEVGATIVPETEDATIQDILDFLELLPHSPIFPDPEPGKVGLDVRLVNALQLEGLGITNEQMAIAPYCTYQEPDYFFSYRRNKMKRVQWSGIVSGLQGVKTDN